MPVEPKDSITASHCVKGYTHKDKQGMKNGCLSSNWGAVCSWAGYSSMEKGAWRRTEKQDMDKNGRRETTCVCVSGSNLCFFMSRFKRASSGTNATKSSPCVCRNVVCRKVCLASCQPETEQRQTGPSVFQDKQSTPAHLFFAAWVSLEPSLHLLAREAVQLLSWLILQMEVKAVSVMGLLFLGLSNVWNWDLFFGVHTVADGQWLCYSTSRA